MNNLLQSLRKLAQPKTIYAFTTMVIVVVLFTLTLDASVYYELSQYKMNYENVTNISV